MKRLKMNGKTEENTLELRLRAYEEKLEMLELHLFYQDVERWRSEGLLESTELGAKRYVRATTDGWLNVIKGSVPAGIPSGLMVRLIKTETCRDYCVAGEGIIKGQSFDVITGNLNTSYDRDSNLVLKSRLKPGGEVDIGGVKYDRDVTLSYTDGDVTKSISPYHSKTNPDNPPPTGKTNMEIPDFPHVKRLGYPPNGTVWFRIGHSGSFYVHAGEISNGCTTCDPATWSKLYEVMHRGLKGDDLSVGVLDYQ